MYVCTFHVVITKQEPGGLFTTYIALTLLVCLALKSLAMASKATIVVSAPKKPTEKPEKPDEAIFKETKEALGKEIQDLRDQLVSLKK